MNSLRTKRTPYGSRRGEPTEERMTQAIQRLKEISQDNSKPRWLRDLALAKTVEACGFLMSQGNARSA